MSKRETGLSKQVRQGAGASVLYRETGTQGGADSDGAGPQSQPEKSGKKADKAAEKTPKVRTTVMLSTEAFAELEELKAEARRAGKKRTYSDILDEAIRLLKAKTDAAAARRAK